MIVLPGVRRRRANASAGFGEGAHFADDRLEPPVAHSLGQIRKLRAVGFDHEEDSAPILGLYRRWRGDGHQGAAGAHQRR